MAEPINVITICGSLRKGSYNAALARQLPGACSGALINGFASGSSLSSSTSSALRAISLTR